MTLPFIPDSALDTHIGVLGRTGTGKSYTARGLVERLIEARRQVVIVDPTGAWWGLRSAYAIPIFGGEHGDITITEDSGEAVARTIIENSTSAIVDLSLLARQSGAAIKRFMRAFVARLKDKDPGAIWLVLDEADEFLPQVLSPDMTHLFGDLKWIVRRGRIAGWRVMMITQRPQDIAKAVLTQIGTLVAHRLTAPQDRKAVEEWVKGHADPEEAREVLATLAKLGQGEAWVWWPEGDLLSRQVSPPIKSFDSGATPDAGAGAIEQPKLTDIDMSAIRATLLGGAERLRPGTVEALEADYLIESAVGQQQLDDAYAQIAQLLQANQNLGTRAREAESALAALQGAYHEFAATIAAIEIPAIGQRSADEETVGKTEGRQVMMSAAPRAEPQRQRHDPQEVTAGETATQLNASARKMLEMLERISPARVPWGSLSAMVGNKARGGNFNSARKAMRESGLIIEDGDSVRSAKAPNGGMSRDDAIALWHSVLSNPAPRMMMALHVHERLTKAEIGEKLNILPRGGNFNNGIAQLIRNGVAIDRGGVLSLAEPLPGEQP